MALYICQRSLPSATCRRHRLGVLGVNTLPETMPRQRAIHRAGIHMNETQRLGDQLGVGALAARARAINGNDDGVYLHNSYC